MSFSAQRIEFRFEVLGEAMVHRRFEGIAKHADDWTPALEQIADSFEDHMTAVFESGGTASAGHWPALSPEYAAWKAKHYPGRPILTRGGGLAASMSGGEGHVRQVTAKELTVGSSLRVKSGRWSLGALHQEGTSRMPRRRIINIPEWLKRRWVQFLRDHIMEPGR